MLLKRVPENFLENNLFSSLLYARYLDDIIQIQKWHSLTTLNRNPTNAPNAAITRFTDTFAAEGLRLIPEQSDETVTFLDVVLFKSKNVICSKTFQKPKNKFIYLHQKSNHPNTMKRGTVYSLLFNYVIANSEYHNYRRFKILLCQRLSNRGYSPAFVRLSPKPKYAKRNEYIDGIVHNIRRKRLKNVYDFYRLETAFGAFDTYQKHFKDPTQRSVFKAEYDSLCAEMDVDRKIKMFFKFEYEAAFSQGNLKGIFTDAIDLLPEEIKDKMEFVMCRTIGTKVKDFLH